MYKLDILVENCIAHCVRWINTAAVAAAIWWCA